MNNAKWKSKVMHMQVYTKATRYGTVFWSISLNDLSCGGVFSRCGLTQQLQVSHWSLKRLKTKLNSTLKKWFFALINMKP